jgi:hypothetical protein
MNAFTALKADGSIKAWTDSGSGRKRAPAGKGYTGIYSNPYAFAALVRRCALASSIFVTPRLD